MKRDTLVDFFESIVAQKGVCLVYDDGLRPRSYTYEQLGAAARRFALRLAEAGVARGDRVILWSENRPAWIAAFWGCQLRGAAVVPIDEKHSPDFLTRVVRITSPKVILLGDAVRLEPPPPGIPVWRLADLDWRAPAPAPPPAEISAADTAQILFTSGATADPKGVVITHRNILANIVPVEREIRKYLHYARPFQPIRFLDLLPLSHMFGQAMAAFIPPILGGTVVFLRTQDPREIVRQIRTRRVSVLVSVPRILELLREYILAVAPESAEPAPPGERFWRRWWRYRRVHRLFGWKFWSFIVGGAALDGALEQFWGRLGFAVIQGYGLTEAAPIVTLNHPFHARQGSVGKPIAGVEIRIAPDGEVLVRGPNITSGYFNDPEATAEAFEDGWLHTGDIGELDAEGRLYIKGRKKEMIVLPDGRNVFPEDVEKILNALPGVRESAVIGIPGPGGESVHAALVLDPDTSPEAVLREANSRLEEHQRIRSFTLWPDPELPRTEGTRKLKRRLIRQRVSGGAPAFAKPPAEDPVAAILARYAGGRQLAPDASLDDLGLSSLDRIELMVALEQQLGRTLDEAAFASARTVSDLRRLETAPPAPPAEPFEFPRWSRARWAHWHRVFHLNAWVLWLARLFAWVRVEGRENLEALEPPVLFASNHQGYFDTPVLFIAMPWKWRHRLAPAMRKEFFDAHFHPERFPWWQRLTNSLNYYLACLVFNAVPIPQREAGARDALRYLGELAGEGWCPLIFPEGKHSRDDSILPFLPGIGVMAARLGIPVVPVRIRGSNRVLHPDWRFPRPGVVRVKIGKPVRLEGEDHAALARRLEEIIRSM
ncbi:MAG: AMP-binding protein [Bryobacteraceae bacterium]